MDDRVISMFGNVALPGNEKISFLNGGRGIMMQRLVRKRKWLIASSAILCATAFQAGTCSVNIDQSLLDQLSGFINGLNLGNTIDNSALGVDHSMDGVNHVEDQHGPNHVDGRDGTNPIQGSNNANHMGDNSLEHGLNNTIAVSP